jgi:hypothetical protein
VILKGKYTYVSRVVYVESVRHLEVDGNHMGMTQYAQEAVKGYPGKAYLDKGMLTKNRLRDKGSWIWEFYFPG